MAPTVAQYLRDVRIAKEARRLPEALVAIEAALAIAAEDAFLLLERSAILRGLGRADEARQTAHRATVLAPTSAEAHAQLGLAFLELGKLANAESSFRRAEQFDRGNASMLGGYGALRLRQNRLPEAESFLINAVRARPADATLLVLLGDVFGARGNRAGMLEAFRHARQLDPSNTEALDKYLAAKEMDGGIEAARASLEEAVARMPDVALVHTQLGTFLAAHGMLDEAAASFRRAVDLDPLAADALQFLGERQRTASADNEDLKRIQEGYLQSLPGTTKRAVITIALAKATDASGDCTAAFDLYAEGNAIVRRSMSFSLDKEREAFASIARTFSSSFLARFSGRGHQSSSPIFIVGMPRSGTTLTETVLSKDSRVFAAGELEFLRTSATSIVGASPVLEAESFAKRLTAPLLAEIGSSYLSQLGAAAKASLFMTDKMPHNFRLVGLIRLVFPNARIVHVRRDPLDNCLSLFKANLGSEALAFSRDLVELGRYYNLYRRLMAHWRATLPGEFFEIDYEALVSDPETATRALFSYCGLHWSPEVLAIEDSRREVMTASFAQVRQPINTRSVRAADRYGNRLDPLRAALAEYDG